MARRAYYAESSVSIEAPKGSLSRILMTENPRLFPMQAMRLRYTLCAQQEAPKCDHCRERRQLRAFGSCRRAYPAFRRRGIMEVPGLNSNFDLGKTLRWNADPWLRSLHFQLLRALVVLGVVCFGLGRFYPKFGVGGSFAVMAVVFATSCLSPHWGSTSPSGASNTRPGAWRSPGLFRELLPRCWYFYAHWLFCTDRHVSDSAHCRAPVWLCLGAVGA